MKHNKNTVGVHVSYKRGRKLWPLEADMWVEAMLHI